VPKVPTSVDSEIPFELRTGHGVRRDFLDNLSIGPCHQSLLNRDGSSSRCAVFIYAQKTPRIRQPVACAGRLLAELP